MYTPMHKHSSPPTNGNGNATINGRGIKHRDLTHYELAADAVAGIHPVVPSLGQMPAIFPSVTQTEVSAELKRREASRKQDEAQTALLNFIQVWDAGSPDWRVEAVRTIGVVGVWDAIAGAIK
jgi:hypothetical protein